MSQKVKCDSCKGRGHFEFQGDEVRCVACGGTGQIIQTDDSGPPPDGPGGDTGQ